MSSRRNTSPLPDNTHVQEIDINDPGGIWTRNPSKRATADLRLRPRDHLYRHTLAPCSHKITLLTEWVHQRLFLLGSAKYKSQTTSSNDIHIGTKCSNLEHHLSFSESFCRHLPPRFERSCCTALTHQRRLNDIYSVLKTAVKKKPPNLCL